MKLEEIKGGSLVILQRGEEKLKCIVSSGGRLINLYDGTNEGSLSAFDSEGAHGFYKSLTIELVYSCLTAYLSGEESPIWIRYNTDNFYIGQKIALRSDLKIGAGYGSVICSQIIEYFAGSVVTVVGIDSSKRTLKVSYAGSKPIQISLSMVENHLKKLEGETLNHSIKGNPFLTEF